MAIIVDGYNVLHACRWLPSSWKGADRSRFCRLLGELSRHEGEKITVVFDAMPSEPGLGVGKSPGVEIIFSGHKRTADDVIIQMIKSSSGPRDLTIVSSDREIKTAARRRGCKVRTAGEFIKTSASQLARAQNKQASEPAAKEKGLSGEQTKKWLEEFGIDPGQDKDPYEGMRRG